MIRLEGLDYRRAEERDVFPLMRLYQRAQAGGAHDRTFLDLRRLREAVLSTASRWLVAERDGELLACLSLLIDRENRLAKINRLHVDPSWAGWAALLREALPRLLRQLREDERQVEVVYVTTRSLALHQQEVLLDSGFKILGVIPIASGSGDSRVSGLTALYLDDVLSRRRHAEFSLHPFVAPFYELVAKECGLAPLPLATRPDMASLECEPLPALELIDAPLYVGARFERLQERRTLAVHFYPFSKPNALVTNANESVELYLKLMPESRMATVIGERLDLSVNPAELYAQVGHMLHARGIHYVEAINDAADLWGIEAISSAGFLPCAYFPCLKDQGDSRRDYVVLARTFELPFSETHAPRGAHGTLREFFREYYTLEARCYLEKLKA